MTLPKFNDDGSINLNEFEHFDDLLRMEYTKTIEMATNIICNHMGQLANSTTAASMQQQINEVYLSTHKQFNPNPLLSWNFGLDDSRDKSLVEHIPTAVFNFTIHNLKFVSEFYKTKHSWDTCIELKAPNILHGSDKTLFSTEKDNYILSKIELKQSYFACTFTGRSLINSDKVINYYVSDPQYKVLYKYLLASIEDKLDLPIYEMMENLNFKPEL